MDFRRAQRRKCMKWEVAKLVKAGPCALLAATIEGYAIGKQHFTTRINKVKSSPLQRVWRTMASQTYDFIVEGFWRQSIMTALYSSMTHSNWHKKRQKNLKKKNITYVLKFLKNIFFLMEAIFSVFSKNLPRRKQTYNLGSFVELSTKTVYF